MKNNKKNMFDTINFNGVEYPIIRFTSPELTEYRGLKAMYFGIGGFSDGSYLVRHPREEDDFYEARQALAHYENAFQPELDASVDPIFSKIQDRNVVGPGEDVVKAFIANPSKRDETMSEYVRRNEIDTALYGSSWIVEDAPTEVPENGSKDTNSDFLPYTYYLTPLDITGYNLDAKGALQLLVYPENVCDRGYVSESSLEDIVYRVWMTDVDGNNVTFQYVNEMIVADTLVVHDKLPVLLRENNTRYNPAYICKSKYLSLFGLSVKRYNYQSQVDDSYFKNCFAFLAVNEILPQDIAIGNDGVLSYQGQNIPGYVAPPMAHIDSMNAKNDNLRKNLKEDMNSSTIISSEASGEAREAADKRRIEKLKQTAKDLSDVEMWMIDVALRLYIDVDYAFTVIYVDDFESLTKADSLNTYQSLIDSTAMNVEVIKEIGVDMISIVYSNEPERRDFLIALQRKTSAFEDTDLISDDDVIEIEE